jgi:hypothetical protein
MEKINIIILLLVLYLFYKVHNKQENFAATNKDVKKIVNEVYKADLESIRNLGEISKKLQKGGLTIPGDLRVKGELNIDKDLSTKGKLKVDKDISTKGNGIIGNAYIGKWKTNSGEYAAFCHKNRMKSDNYSILSKNSGKTYLSTNDVLSVRKNNKMRLRTESGILEATVTIVVK